MNVWKPVDLMGYWLAAQWTPVRQIRTGVLATIAGVILIVVGFFVDEPPLIYQMSAWTFMFGGLGIVVTAVLALKEDPDLTEEDLKP